MTFSKRARGRRAILYIFKHAQLVDARRGTLKSGRGDAAVTLRPPRSRADGDGLIGENMHRILAPRPKSSSFIKVYFFRSRRSTYISIYFSGLRSLSPGRAAQQTVSFHLRYEIEYNI